MSEDLAGKIQRIRVAADKLATGSHDLTIDELAPIVASWMHGEAACMGEMESCADILNFAIEKSGGPKSLIRFARDEHGQIQFFTDTSNHAAGIADRILKEKP